MADDPARAASASASDEDAGADDEGDQEVAHCPASSAVEICGAGAAGCGEAGRGGSIAGGNSAAAVLRAVAPGQQAGSGS